MIERFINKLRLYINSEKGAHFVKEIMKKEKDTLIFLAVSGIGDICYSFSFLNTIKKNHKVMVLTRQYTYNLVKSYDAVDEVLVLDKKQIRIVDSFLAQPGRNANILNNGINGANVFSCSHWRTFNYSIMRIADNYLEVIRRVIYNVDRLAEITFPNVRKSRNYVEHPERVIIINPYSNFLDFQFRDEFIFMTQFFLRNGYKVYTNTTGKNQGVIDGTEPLECSIEELYNLTSVCALFVSVRSGILDFTINNNGNYLVIYPDVWDGLFRKAYTLSAWNTNSSIIECTLQNNNPGENRKVLEKLVSRCLIRQK